MHKSFLGYRKPAAYRPQWYVGDLVFQGGNPNLKKSSLTGGGQIYGREFTGPFQPVLIGYSAPLVSTVGSGNVVKRPSILDALFGGAKGNGS